MSDIIQTGFCTECRKTTACRLQTEPVTRYIHGAEHTFSLTTARCEICGADMNPTGLLDVNIREIDEQYRAAEHILTIGDIQTLMDLYSLGKAPLSLAMGFGEVTISRYLDGQIPSREYSDRMRKALSSPAFMKSLLMENKDRLTPAAWRKGMQAVQELEQFSTLSPAIRSVILRLFSHLDEITPLMLQKLLYYIQSLSLTLHNEPAFPETCQAWVHGPVFPSVYRLFRSFTYDPIDDARFSIFRQTPDPLTENVCRVVDLVSASFGLYSGKVLEAVTHGEDPWKKARSGLPDDMHSSREISRQEMKAWFDKAGQQYSLCSCEGLNQYIQDLSFCLFHPATR